VPHPFRNHPARAELRKLYDKTDALLAHLSCDSSAECCHFGITGREPYPTAVELAELDLALASAGLKLGLRAPAPNPGGKKQRRLEVVGDRRCPILGDDGRCRAYPARPFGCRTFHCGRARGGGANRAEIKHISQAIADLSARFAPRDPGPRPLLAALRSRA
jgi:Fe-S-cluster containining protein